MKTLLINTCTNRIIVAIADDSTIFSFCNEIIENQMSNIIMNKISTCFKEAQITPNEVDQILVAVGPGSYTGIRIGVTIAKTMAWALNKKLIPISSLEMMISGYTTDSLLVPLIDARRKAVFAGIYDSNLDILTADQYVSLEDLEKRLEGKEYIFVSDDQLENVKNVKIDIIKILNKHQNDEGINPHALNPIYLKKTEAEENLHD